MTERHPFVEFCAAAKCDPDAAALRFPGRPYREAAWLADLWQMHHPREQPPGPLTIAGMIQDYAASR